MAVTTEIPTTFASKLEAELHARDMGARTLARVLVDRHGGNLDHTRRTIIRWLRGSTPVAENRRMVEDALGLDRDALKPDPPAMPSEVVERVRQATDDLVEALVGALMERIRVPGEADE